eukprot:TRINITY_DN5342_c0_g1_i4.p1 TRINITY_DN5342_c0_g1~~TRINITY_DN5342_c0_g1_i4.p1  ORF type:complete len:111 (-),score=0.87 TRINITY_DN5342_c0_g1_i4:337-669(-)
MPNKASMSASICKGLTSGSYLRTGFPSLLIKNFEKFHVISVDLTGLQIMYLGLVIIVPGSPQDDLRKVNKGCSFWPLTSPFENNGKSGTNPPPGRAYLRQFGISAFVPGS